MQCANAARLPSRTSGATAETGWQLAITTALVLAGGPRVRMIRTFIQERPSLPSLHYHVLQLPKLHHRSSTLCCTLGKDGAHLSAGKWHGGSTSDRGCIASLSAAAAASSDSAPVHAPTALCVCHLPAIASHACLPCTLPASTPSPASRYTGCGVSMWDRPAQNVACACEESSTPHTHGLCSWFP